ncbi:MAG: GspH/FimT family protein [Burkholderiaceae bacterium]
MAVLVIVSGMVLPGMWRWLDSIRIGVLVRAFQSDLQLTRMEAIRRGERVVLCAAESSDACSSRPGWHQGWLMFVDLNNNTEIDPDEPVLRYHGPVSPGWRVQGNRPVARYVSYGRLGMTKMVSGAFQAGSVYFCRQGGGASAPLPRRVVINSAGRPRSEILEGHEACA